MEGPSRCRCPGGTGSASCGRNGLDDDGSGGGRASRGSRDEQRGDVWSACPSLAPANRDLRAGRRRDPGGDADDGPRAGAPAPRGHVARRPRRSPRAGVPASRVRARQHRGDPMRAARRAGRGRAAQGPTAGTGPCHRRDGGEHHRGHGPAGRRPGLGRSLRSPRSTGRPALRLAGGSPDVLVLPGVHSTIKRALLGGLRSSAAFRSEREGRRGHPHSARGGRRP